MSTDPQLGAATSKKWDLSQGSFDRLLAWLNPDREQAGKKYEDIRRRLIKIFICRGCYEAEELADETINRVARKVDEIAETYSGDPALYFYGVAHKVHLEYLKKNQARRTPLPSSTSEETDKLEQELSCLDICMQRLTPNNRNLVLEYYREEKRAKIDYRQNLAQKLGIALNALRIRAFRIRAALQECMQNCLDQSIAN